MQQYILIKPMRGPARLSLGMIGDLPEPWQHTAENLLKRRQQRLARYHHLSRPRDFTARSLA